MNKYELMIILDPKASDDANEKLTKKIEKIITSAKAEEVETQVIGKKRLAYEIKKNKEGYYVVLTFKANTDVIKEIERKVKLEDEIVRYLLIKTEVDTAQAVKTKKVTKKKEKEEEGK